MASPMSLKVVRNICTLLLLPVLVPAFLAPLRGSICRLSALGILGRVRPCGDASPQSPAQPCSSPLQKQLGPSSPITQLFQLQLLVP